MTRSTTWRTGARLDVALALAVLYALAVPPAAQAADRVRTAPHTTIVVRVYDGSGLATRDVREANRVASDILAEAGIDLQWRLCPDLIEGVDACRQPLAANEAVLRIIPAAAQMTAEPAALGFTLLDPTGRQAVLSTVFIDRVLDVATRAKVDPTLLAGRAMAHEIGHLLLGTSGHASGGLMRAFWSDDTLRSRARDDWFLLPEEADAIRANRLRAPDIEVAGGSQD
ncbi:MAG: hypothetical protein QM736_03245 [Vicinamibacterales bacterium]